MSLSQLFQDGKECDMRPPIFLHVSLLSTLNLAASTAQMCNDQIVPELRTLARWVRISGSLAVSALFDLAE